MDRFDRHNKTQESRGTDAESSVPWARFSAWLECVCVVTFDLDLGQAIECTGDTQEDTSVGDQCCTNRMANAGPKAGCPNKQNVGNYPYGMVEVGSYLIYPHDAKLTEKEKTSICYLSFPDSFSGCLGDTQFCFRLRHSVGRVSGVQFGEKDAYNMEAQLILQKEMAHFYGYVYFRQVKDVSVRRGYFQKSLVLVSRLPYVHLFQYLLQIIAPEYFEKSEPCLEAVCNEIDQWPPPMPSQTLNLPVMGVILQVRIPSKDDKPEASPIKQGQKEKHLSSSMILPTINELDLFKCFQSVLIHIQLLWELMLLGEPLVVMAPSPTVSSETVLALVSCISPLKYCCDFRPYFTIYDSEFKEYSTRRQSPPNVLLGVTNPFFIKTFQSWPHIMCLGELKVSRDLLKQVKVKKLAKLKTLDTKPGIYTEYKTFLHKDKALIKRLLKGAQRKKPSEVQSTILRWHLLELTQSFMVPLEQYLASLMPLQISMTPWKTPPQIRPFSQDEFMASLEHAGPQTTSTRKGDWLGLYKQFFQSSNFDGWFRAKHREMSNKMDCLHLEAICDADLLSWTKDKSGVEIVDLILKLREKLARARTHQLPVKWELLNKLENYIHSVISSLPEDLQTLLHKD